MIVITTPTGDIGSQLLTNLLSTAEDLRVIVRDPARLTRATLERAEIITGSHGDAAVVDQAFDGADAVFWCVPPAPGAPSLEAAYSGFTQAAAHAIRSHRVGHVVGVSALGRGTVQAGNAGLVTASLAMDDLLGSTGTAYRALANPSFMDNLLRDVNDIRGGSFTDTVDPDRMTPRAATRDIAAAGSRLLLDRSWTGVGEVAVLGPGNLSQNDLAVIMSDVLGREISYHQQSLEELAATMSGYGLGAAFVDGMVEMMRAKDNGLDDAAERTAETASPTTFRQWCVEVLRPAVLGA